MQSLSKNHVVLFSYEGWGHLRPLTVFAARIVKTRPIHVTLLTSPRAYDRVVEISRSFGEGDDTLRNLIRVIAVTIEGDSSMLNPVAINNAFATAYKHLAHGEHVKCSKSNIVYDALPIPTSVVLDFFAKAPLETVRATTHSVKVYGWFTGAATYLNWAFGPSRADFRPKVFSAVKETGRSLGDVAEEIVFATTGEVLHSADLPPMYDHEHQPQARACDGLIMSTAEPYELQAIASVKAWFAETSRSVYSVGPLLSPVDNPRSFEEEKKTSAKAKEIDQFMDTIYKSHGEKSLVYIAFGSVFWSTQPEKIWSFLDVLIEKKIPFIMSHASPFAVVPESVKENVTKYGLGLLSQWTPQQSILSHPATGWFVTHCGQNGIMEAITLEVPMICWPFSADQPSNAARLSDILNVAYELFEVRNGLGLKPTLRNGKVPTGTPEAIRAEAHQILESAFGKEGEKKRENLKKVKEEILGAWKEGGSSYLSMNALVEVFCA
ncbi:hypothetical protein NLI96_g2320 [Meripilus lineatus]|uniref:Glycosyltransferase n=1 Tax=Meripilus lineatus TaxID=2056292 RepID=A0AAD5YHL1_9APHY|nr:hypothetical protein NLI96_g2320 [Physisporinus lineatus]